MEPRKNQNVEFSIAASFTKTVFAELNVVKLSFVKLIEQRIKNAMPF